MPRNRKYHYVKIISKDSAAIARVPWPFDLEIVDFAQAVCLFFGTEEVLDVVDAVPLPSKQWRGADAEAAWKRERDAREPFCLSTWTFWIEGGGA